MRTIVELPAEQIETLRELSARTELSRAELIRRAVAEYLARHQPPVDDQAFGLWRARDVDALHHQDRLRAEWDR